MDSYEARIIAKHLDERLIELSINKKQSATVKDIALEIKRLRNEK